MGTFSKAAGSFGAYCCGSQELISYFINHARSFVYTTALPPAVAMASLAAIDIIETQPSRREQLWENTRYLLNGFKDLGFDTMKTQTPIIPLLVKDAKMAVEFSRKLLDKGIFVSAIRPPTVPLNAARLRVTVMATHQRQDLDYLLEQSKKIGKELCLL